MKMNYARGLLLFLFMIGAIFLSAQDTTALQANADKRIKQYERGMEIQVNPDSVFAFMDDIRNTGKHMTEKSVFMFGSKLSLHWLSESYTGKGTRYRWTGKVVGMPMDFTVEVRNWEKGKSKLWGTIGETKMIVLDKFDMYLLVLPTEAGTSKVKLGILYVKHKGLWGFLFGKWYAKWCVKSMLRDTKKEFEKKNGNKVK